MNTWGLFEQREYQGGNRLVFSRFRDFDRSGESRAHIGIKYVISGTENYQFNRREFAVGRQQYLLINAGQVHDTYLQSDTDVLGICINIDQALLADVQHTHRSSVGQLLDQPINPLSAIDVFENLYNAAGCPLGEALNRIGLMALTGAEMQCAENIHFHLAEQLLYAQGMVSERISQVNATSATTRKELFRRVEQGRRLMEDLYATALQVEDVALASALSPFHFSRVFKQVYGLSPHQFMIHKRLEKAKSLLRANDDSIAAIAQEVGFSDIHSFSKSFRKHCKLSPSSFKAQQRNQGKPPEQPSI